jgi:purine-nucleoside phosphorylase
MALDLAHGAMVTAPRRQPIVRAVITDPWAASREAAAQLAARTGVERHDVFVVLGSGWAHVAELLPPGSDVPMVALPGFPAPSALGHGGAFRSIPLDGRHLLLALGRIHLYEGHGPLAVAHGVRTAAAAGCQTVVLTNAAGSLHREWPLGRPVVIRDQINFTGASPLTGANPPAGFPGRFADMTEAYTARLRALVHEVEPGLPEGVYTGFHGPEFETPAEIEMSRKWGGDLVGMSTVLEAIAASHLGLDVLGLSLATNLAAGMGAGRLDGDHVVAVAKANAPYVGDLLLRILTRIVAG